MQISQLTFILPGSGSIVFRFSFDSIPLLTHNEVRWIQLTSELCLLTQQIHGPHAFWASNCSTSSSSFSTSSDGTRCRGKALRSRKGRGKTKPCGPRCLLHLHILDKVFPFLLPFNLRNCADRLKDRHEMTCMNKSCWNLQPQRQRPSTNRNKYCILLHLSYQAMKRRSCRTLRRLVKLQQRHFQFGLRCWACVRLSLGSSERGVCYVQFICIQL